MNVCRVRSLVLGLWSLGLCAWRSPKIKDLRPKTKLIFLLVVLLALGCHKSIQTPAITFSHNVIPNPPAAGAVTIELELTDKNGLPVSGARVELEGNMSHPGMSPVSATTTEIAPGKYRGTMQLAMAGDWIVLVNVTLSDGERLQHSFELNGVRSN